eukprot:scaffold19245_cov199-Amphora_coffeaeformis.AAC.31
MNNHQSSTSSRMKQAALRFFRKRRGGRTDATADSATGRRGSCLPHTADGEERLRLPAFQNTTNTNDDSTNNGEDSNVNDDLPEYNLPDLVVGELLGQGTFATVHAIVCLPKRTNDHKRPTDLFSGDYALKRLHADKVFPNIDAVVADLATEAWILHQLPHKHMVQLHGLVCDPHPLAGVANKALVVDRLHSTLREERRRWYKWSSRRPLEQLRLLRPTTYQHVERVRLTTAVDLASAIQHLHAHDIVHRDLKPSNVGFDKNGVVKLFDFGFARSIPVHKTTTGDNNDNDGALLYRMTARMGTWRYMAPEVARGEPYNLKCDVYSLALIYWEMVVGAKPYGDLANHSDELRALVTAGTVRPALTPGVVDGHWTDLLEQAWHPTIQERSTIQQVHTALRTQLDKVASHGQSQHSLFKRQ